jgi:hypothetical protein
MRGSPVAAYASLLEGARRRTLGRVTRRQTDAYLEALAWPRALAGFGASCAPALVLGAADGLIIERLAAGEGFELRPQLRRLATPLAAT